MSLIFNLTADPRSIAVYKGKNYIGDLQWHSDYPKRFTINPESPYISIDDMKEITERMDEIVKSWSKPYKPDPSEMTEREETMYGNGFNPDR